MNLSIPYRPAGIFLLLNVGITMHVGRDLDSKLTEIRDMDTIDLNYGLDGLMTEIRNLENLLIEFRDSISLLTEIRDLCSVLIDIMDLDSLFAEIRLL